MGSNPCNLDALLDDADARARAGGKAVMLAILRASGHPVPGGLVVLPGEIDPGANLRPEGGDRFVVRSSSASEDGVGNVAPGVFESLLDVASADLEEALRVVRASAASEHARAYATARGTAFPAPIAVLIQPQLAPQAQGTLYTRRSKSNSEMVLEVVGAPGQAPLQRTGDLPAVAASLSPHLSELRERAIEIEKLVAGDRGADIEWLVADDQLWIVQARPLGRALETERRGPSAGAFAFAESEPDATWAWDINHNPEPLSRAQQGLVELVVAELGAELAIADGYLYEKLRATTPAPSTSAAELGEHLDALFFSDVAPQLDALLSPLEAIEPALEDALSVFVEVNHIYGHVLRPVIAAAKRESRRATDLGVGTRLLENIADPALGFSDSARALAARDAARGGAWYWAPYANAWDVASPAFAEDPEMLADLTATLSSRDHMPPGDADRLALLIAAVAELDDRFFYRAQRVVRRAILALPGNLDEAHRFELELERLRGWAGSKQQPDRAHERAESNRRERLEARARSMPLRVRGANQLERPRGDGRGVLVGKGRGGQCRGRVSLAAPTGQPADALIVVAVDLTPGEILRAKSASAIVLERDAQLGHAAALARELGIPIITGVSAATTQLREGERVWLDADAGLIVRLD